MDICAQKKNISFEHILVNKGISANSIRSIIKDSKGFMWFGTHDGLNRFDGYNTIVFKNNPKDSTSLSNNWIYKIYEDRSGTLWIGTNGGGLNKFDRDKEIFIHYKNEVDNINSLSNNRVREIYEDNRGILWIGTDDGLNKFNPENEVFKCYKKEEGQKKSLSNNNVRVVFQQNNYIENRLWIGTDGGGLNKFDPEKETFVHFLHEEHNPYSISSNNVRAICEGNEKSKNILWIGTDNGLNKFDYERKKFIHYKHEKRNHNSLSHNQIMDIYNDNSSILWIGTKGGLNKFYYDQKIFVHYKNKKANPNSLSDNIIMDIFKSDINVLWIGTEKGGINKLNLNMEQFSHITSEPGNLNSLSHKHVSAIYEDRSGVLWVGTHDGGLNKMVRDKNNYEIFRYWINENSTPNNWNYNYINTIFEDRFGTLWIGAAEGLYRLDRIKGTFKRYLYNRNDPKSLSHNRVRAIYEDRRGNLWIGTKDGLDKFNRKDGTFIHFKHDDRNYNSLINNSIRVIYEDKMDLLWIGTDGGLDKYDTQSKTFFHYKHEYDNPYSLSYDKVRSIYEDYKGTIWIGTRGGLNKLNRDTNQFIHYSINDGLPSNVIYGILEDTRGYLWLSTLKGLSKFNSEKNIFNNFNEDDGLLNSQFEVGAYFKNKNNEMLFGGINGIDIFYPNNIIENLHVPPVVITGFKKFNNIVKFEKSITEIKEIKLSYKDSFFSFEFAVLDFVNPLKNQYAYKLEGFDSDWIYSKKKGYASYKNLNPGNYNFRIKGSNKDGIWNEDGTSVRVTISPPYWRTWWFLAICVFMIFILIIVIYRFRAYGIREKNRQLEEINSQLHEQIVERKRAEEEKEKIRAQLFQSQKMEAIGKLAGGVAHDFNNILTAIHGCVDVALMNINDKDPLYTDLKEILNDVDHASSLTRQLLLFSRKHLMNFNPLKINKMIIKLFKMLQRLIGENIEIVLDLDSDLWTIQADRGTIEQVIMNLVINARDAMINGGQLKIKTENVELDEDQCNKISEARSGTFVCLSVKDTGVGIDKNVVEQLFEPFFTTKKSGRGTGLGLSVVYGIVKQHEGWIDVYSETGNGAEFKIYLPSITDDSNEETDNSVSIDKLKGHGEKVLVVEDEESVLEFVKRALKECGYNVCSAASAWEALDIFEKEKRDFKLLFSDVVLPDRNGVELADEVLSRCPDIKVLLTSGYTDQQSQWRAIRDRGFPFLQKPYMLVDLLRSIKEVLDGN
jgi:ligand-binding sensor domain-containing protein/signal transduction histidine kinase/CheY-like chemotaxis protein